MTYRDNFPAGGRIIRIDVRPATKADADAFIAQLLKADWNAPNSPIQMADDLSYDEVKYVLFFDQARQFLRLMEENRGAPLTAMGNLNRAYVALMMEKLDWLRRHMAPLVDLGVCKVFNEQDVRPLEVLHGVCEYGKLIHKRRNRAFVTNKGRELLAAAHAGSLYRLLLLTLFQQFDLDFLSGYRETPYVQDSMAVILWRLQMMARDWATAEQLTGEVFLYSVSDQIKAVSPWPTAEAAVLADEVLEPLTWFGLLVCDQPLERWHHRDKPKYRKSPLFDRFLTFNYLP
jgi:hypothetical protein